MKVLNYSDPKLDEIVGRLIPEFLPTKIFLFGARVNETPRDSDAYELCLVIKESEDHPITRMQKALRVLTGLSVRAEVFVRTQEEFDDWKDEFSSLPHTVITEGLVLEIGS